MYKKTTIISICLIFVLIVGGIIFSRLFLGSPKEITAQEAEALCYTVMGEADSETGFTFSFGFTEVIEKDGKEYYVIRASWLVNGSHMSYIGDFFVTKDGKEIYSGIARPDEYTIENKIWSK